MNALTERHLLSLAYGACAGLAIGSCLQWVTGPLGDPVFRAPVPTLLGAGLASLVLWRWSAGGRRWLLIVVMVFAALCAAIAVYAIYDIQDLYKSSGDAWFNRIGVGLVFTLISAVALGVLCAGCYLHGRKQEPQPPSRPRRVWLLALALCALGGMAVWIVWPFGEKSEPEQIWMDQSGRPIPDFAVKVVGGQVDEAPWGIWLFGNREGGNCWGTRTGEVLSSERAHCNFNVPPNYSQLAGLGLERDQDALRSVFFFLTKREIGHLRLLLDRNGGEGTQMSSVRVQTQALDPKQSARAHLLSNFRYAVARIDGVRCIRHVAVFDRSGGRVEASRLRACGKQSSAKL